MIAAAIRLTRRLLERLVALDCERKHPGLEFYRLHPGTAIDLDLQHPDSSFCAAPELGAWVEMRRSGSGDTAMR